MNRRDVLLLWAITALPVSVRAQDRPRIIGFVSWWPPQVAVHAEQFRKGMSDLGYVEGRDIVVKAHFVGGSQESARDVIRTLVLNKVEVLVVSTTPAIAIAKEEAGTLPIVMSPVSDPIAAGFAKSLSRPGGNLTGMSTFSPGLVAKRLELVREIRPELRTIAFLGSSKDVNTATFLKGLNAEANRIGLKLLPYLIDGPANIEPQLLEAMRREGAEAVMVQPIFMGHQETIVPLANAAGLPIVADYSLFAEAGALFTYGIDDHAQMRKAAYFVDQILRGVPPGDLPIQQPTEFRLVVNAAAAKRFGWTIPVSILALADTVIE
jgi:putative ABC transport system substrate-binding protein